MTSENKVVEKDPKVRRIDYIELCSFVLCKRKWYARHFLSIVPKAARPPLDFGIALHEALDVMYQTKFDLEAVLEKWHSLKFEADMKRTSMVGELMLKSYHTQYCEQNMEALHHEVIWELPFDHFNLCGRMDRVVQWHDGLWIMDHKTSSRMGATYFEQFNPHMQVSMYLHAGRQYFGDDVRGFIADALFVGKTNKNQRDVVTIGEEELSQRMDEVLHHSYELVDTETSLKEKPAMWRTTCPRAMITETCSAWGCCEYRDLCRYGYKPKFIEAQFRKEVWTPAGGDPDGKVGQDV